MRRIYKMNKDDFEILTKDLKENSVRKACYVAREYLRCKKYNVPSSFIKEEEFYNALNILLAHSYQTSDDKTIVEFWHCESDCDRNNSLFGFCPGEFQIDEQKRTLCKYYIDPANK